MKHWHRKLAEPIKLKCGGTLMTLANARTYLLSTFTTTAHSALLIEASRDLLHAARTGTAEDIREATDQMKRLLDFDRRI